jgi:flagellar M-ring protein FliF
MGLLGFVVLLMVVRPLVRRVLAPDERRAFALPSPGGLGGGVASGIDSASPGTAAIAHSAGGARAAVNPGELNKTSQMIDLAQVQGQVHAQSVQKVGDIADKNPRETVSIIRQWLQESGAAA